MDQIQKLIDISNAYIKGHFVIKEFQERIESVYLPDECKSTLEKEQHNASNQLEEIIYCYNESQKKYADEVAESLIKSALLEQIRLLE